MRQRVLLMISSMRGGGSERQTLLLLRHLNRARFEPHLYVIERAGDLISEIPDDVRVHSFADGLRPNQLYFPGRILRQQTADLRDRIVAEKIAVVYDRTFTMSLIAAPACQRLGIPRVSTIVSPPERALPLVEKRFLRWKRWRLSAAYRQARTVVAVSKIAARSAETYYNLFPDSVTVIPNPVDRDDLLLKVAATPPRDPDHVTMVCVGRMTSEKGHADLIRAVAISESDWPAGVPPLRLIMVGDGPLRSQLQQLATEKVRRHTIEFVGVDPNPAPRIASANALILPSLFEGMPNVVLEAMALGTPVIATRAGGTIELMDHEPTMLLADPGNPLSLANAIREFVSDRDAAILRADVALRYVRDFHDVNQTTRRIEELFLS
ncbi:glycosyl transferase group 1 family protein [Rhodopirellula maiorica SM1]|uniref:Glycosyl transferase group 1 family protein n=1 Tax=Rhodopirellula maiorica SM1 TaxID=1265738 RepID=M5RDS5_9BACT|nr:glycosyltransferase [Rhodopirellula maiorica]EMI17628.1 glycosyl transferase group 1 family protein [Rhodopirellula maiorica SM1]